MPATRRHALALGAAAAASLAMPAVLRAQTTAINIGFWPLAAGLPLYAGVARGVFAKAGLDVKAVKFAAAPQVIEGMIAGRLQGSGNGVAAGLLALSELTDPGLCKIFCANASNADLVLDEIIVAADSPYKTIADLAGKRVAAGPGIQNVTLAKIIFEKNGYVDPKPIELPIGQHVPALVAGQVDGIYTLEPTGTLGALKGLTRVLEPGVISKYVLGEAKAPWFGGAACVTKKFVAEEPELVKRYVTAYGEAVELVRREPDAVRQYLVGNTSIEADLASKVPLIDFRMFNEFTETDLDYFQKFFDVLSDRKIAASRVLVRPMMYKSGAA